MTDVNLNNPDLRLVRVSHQIPARASASPLAEGSLAGLQPALSSGNVSDIAPASLSAASAVRHVDGGEPVGQAVSRLNDFVQTVQRDLHFEMDRESGETIVKVVDQETQQVIRQIPDEVALRLAEKLLQDEPLTLFDLKV
ncbi:flagellar protein FlaG [Marinobacter salinisoli]|uniref:Flagellar protein FlaG n=1 Tax=Marinobacter salinisoli TaxID=2769486 RepID=A0ABX7MQ78_9GAMM|nr:flagellar protein FlaG [Marinobacter salinisoli]QSP94453.1 flagellar protein FlaG [Marinobacter salinisoli]